MGRVWIGTSGWSYKEWAKGFYPEGCRDELAYYVTQFATVEINATFYRLPTHAMVKKWREKAPDGFVFAVKGSRFITHMKKLTHVAAGLRKYFGRINRLRERTAAVLWQLPPFMQKDVPRLERFLERLPKGFRHAVEFRHPSWMDEESCETLRRHGAALVWISSLRMPMRCELTTDFGYVRFHGLEGGAEHDYTDEELAPWAKEILGAAESGADMLVYFNNDKTVRAIGNARTLQRMAGAAAERVRETE